MPKDAIQNLTGLLGTLPLNNGTFKFFLFNSFVNEISEHDILKGNFKIGGGTRFDAIEESALSKGKDAYPDLVLVFTDGDSTLRPPTFPDRWVWILTKDVFNHRFDKSNSRRTWVIPRDV
jgi:hypothetical protein